MKTIRETMKSLDTFNKLSQSFIPKTANFLIYTLVFICFFINLREIPAFVKMKQVLLLSICGYLCLVRFKQIKFDVNAVLATTIAVVAALHFFYVREVYILTDSFVLITLLSISLWDLSLADTKQLKWIEVLTSVAILLNLIIFRTGGRSTIGNIDPNFSSLLIYLFVCYLLKMKRNKWLISFLVLAGLMTLSRTYFVAILLLLIGISVNNRKFSLFAFLILPLALLSSLHFFTIGKLHDRFPLLHDLSERLYYGSAEHTNPLRILHLVGNTSDNIRSIINVKTIELLFTDKNFLLFGSHPEKFETLHGFKSAHNFFLFQITQSGFFFGILALISVYYLFLKKFDGINIAILIGFGSYISFLGIEVGSVYFLFLMVIIYMNPEILNTTKDTTV